MAGVVLIKQGSDLYCLLLTSGGTISGSVNNGNLQRSSVQQGFQRSSILDHSQMNKCKKFQYRVV